MRPLFIGEAPSPSTSRFGSHPLVGMTGARLAAWAGVSPAEFRRRCGCVNLFDRVPQRWDRRSAEDRAAWLWVELCKPHDGTGRELRGVDVVVLLGDKVADAFRCRSVRPFTVSQTSGPAIAVMPHPSGLNHYWNDEANVRRAERFLRRLLGTGRRPRQARLPMRGAAKTA